LVSGDEVTLTYGQYRALLETNRRQEDRAAAYRAFHQTYANNQNTYASLYNGVLQRDWFHARARGYSSTLDGALHGNNIPTSVVENLIAVAKQNVEPLRRCPVPVRQGRIVDCGLGRAARRRVPATRARSVRWTLD
jgi:oligoendopeptidase F